MKDFIMAHIHAIPWPFMVVKGLEPEKVRLQKIWEGLIIAILTAIITATASGYVMIQVLDAKLEFIQSEVSSNHADIRDLMQNKYRNER